MPILRSERLRKLLLQPKQKSRTLNLHFQPDYTCSWSGTRPGERKVYLDVETQRTAEPVGGWDNLDKLGVSVAAAYSPFLDQLWIFTEDNLADLTHILQGADLVIGYNLIKFDLMVLQGCKGVNVSNLRVCDIMLEVEKALGHRLPLANLRAATLGQNPQYDGLDMIKFWQNGEKEKVLEGCCNDVLAMHALHQYGITHGEVLYYAGPTQQLTKLKVNW